MRDRDYFFQNTLVKEKQLQIAKARALASGKEVDILDEAVDLAWASMSKNSGAPNPYYDYYYSGQDMTVYMAEIADNDPEFGLVPIVAMAFNIQQEKRPVYGFWNYTYNAVMRGTRIVSGQFAIVTKYPNFMRDMIAKAASNRAKNVHNLSDAYPAVSGGLTEDDSKIEEYWGKHLDAAYMNGGGNKEFSIHPPFSLVLVYGKQELDYEFHLGDTALYTDTNQRLLDAEDPKRPNKIILDACELISCNRQYMPDGQVLVETYEFFARDYVTPQEPPPNPTSTQPVRMNRRVV